MLTDRDENYSKSVWYSTSCITDVTILIKFFIKNTRGKTYRVKYI